MKADFWISLRENAAAIESYANAPFEFVGDMQAHIDMVNSTVAEIEDTAQAAQEDAFLMLSDPAASRAGRALRELADAASRSVLDMQSHGPAITTKTFSHDTTLFAIAVVLGADLSRLLELNPKLDPFNVPANTPVSAEE